ncbi:hypothetical protein [Streptomyces sp. NPDC001250]|uniref:hypothetical protein n=1 Tax=unclassified Streptomyces TaxID=2593676 RepID=UPI0033337E10
MPVSADPTVLHPMPEQPRVVLLKPLVKSPLIEVGEYSYYDGRNIARLPAVAWWDWPAEHITEHVRTIMSGSIADLAAATPDRGTVRHA